MFDGQPASTQRDLFGGQGEVKIWDLLGREVLAPFSAALACELEPGGSVGAHVQQRDPELVICLDGEGTAQINGAPVQLRPGALARLPHGSTLAIRNAGEGPLRYLIVKAFKG